MTLTINMDRAVRKKFFKNTKQIKNMVFAVVIAIGWGVESTIIVGGGDDNSTVLFDIVF